MMKVYCILLASCAFGASIPMSKREVNSLLFSGGGTQDSAQSVTGDSSGLFRRGSVIGQGDSGGTVEDSSRSVAVNTLGDSFGSGENNKFIPVSNIFTGPATDLLFRRKFFDGVGILGSNSLTNSDRSRNSNIFTKGNQMLTGQNIQAMPSLTTGGLSSVNSAQQ